MSTTRAISNAVAFDGLIRSFERSLRARNRSEKTISGYCDTAARFEAFCAQNGFSTELSDIRRAHVEEFLADQLARHSASTAATRYRYLQQFFNFAVAEGEVTSSPMEGMSPPKVPDSPVPVLTDEELARLLKVCDGSAFEDRRDLAIIRLFIDGGLRIGEMAGIGMEDLDLDRSIVSVRGKGGHTRLVPFGAKATQALDRYERARRRHPKAASTRLWLGSRGPLTSSGIAQMLERRANTAGINDMHAHRFRHTFAHRWLAGGGNEGDLQALAGWRSPEMVTRYGASVRTERAIDAHRRLGLGDTL